MSELQEWQNKDTVHRRISFEYWLNRSRSVTSPRLTAAGWFVVVLGMFLLFRLGPTAAASTTDWRLEKEQDGISFYLRDFPQSTIPEFKAVTQIPATMARVLAVLLDVDNYQHWIHRCAQSFPLTEIRERQQYIYQQNSVPWARDRDVILRASLSHRNSGQEVKIQLQSVPDFCHHHDSPGCDRIDHGRHVRIDQAVGSYELRQVDNHMVELTWEQHLDPGGRLPSWLVKAMLSDIPLKTLSGLREAVQDAKYRNSRLVVEGDTLRVETTP